MTKILVELSKNKGVLQGSQLIEWRWWYG